MKADLSRIYGVTLDRQALRNNFSFDSKVMVGTKTYIQAARKCTTDVGSVLFLLKTVRIFHN